MKISGNRANTAVTAEVLDQRVNELISAPPPERRKPVPGVEVDTIVIAALRRRGTTTAKSLTLKTGLSTSQVHSSLSRLREAGRVEKIKRSQRGKGRKVTAYKWKG